MGNKWLTLFAWLAIALMVAAMPIMADTTIEQINVDSATMVRSAARSLAGYNLNHPCGLIILCYDLSRFESTIPGFVNALPERVIRNGRFTISEDQWFWAEDTVTKIDLKFNTYADISFSGFKLSRDSITVIFAHLYPGFDGKVIDLSGETKVRCGIKRFPLPFTQKGSITGSVYDAETLEPIEEARVSLPDEQVSAITDDSGKFILWSSQFGKDCRVIVEHGDYDTVDVGLMKMLPQTELRLDIFLTERPSWWQRIFPRKESRALLQLIHFDWGWFESDLKRMRYRVDLVKSWDGDELSRRLGLNAGFIVESIDSTGAWIKYDSVAYRCLLDTTAMKPTAVGSQTTDDRRFLGERIGRKKVEFQSNTFDGADTYGIQWIRTEE